MSLSLAAAGGTALALYAWRRRGGGGDDMRGTGEHPPVDRHFATAHRAPNSFMEDMYFFTEGMRYMWGDILSRWRTVDLLIGLAYLCRKDPEEHPLADIARQGRLFGADLAPEQWPAALAELCELERFFRYCSGLRERRPAPQRQYFRDVLGIAGKLVWDEDLLVQELRAGVLKPSHVLIRDHQLRAIVLAVRGTHSFKDMFTSLTGASKPHHLVDANGVVLGYSHFGMLAAARWIKGQTRARLEQALAESPGYRLVIVGHSLGAGAAALLTMMLREVGGPFAEARCVAVACPSCMTLELAQSCDAYVTSVMHGCDCIPTICPATADALREEMTRSSWWQEFRADVRSSGLVRAVESGLRGVGSATSWTTSKVGGGGACAAVGSSAEAAGGEDAIEDAADDGSPFSSAAGTATGAPTAMDIDGEEEDAVPEGAACEDAAMGAPERCSSSQRRRVQAELQLDSAGSLEEEAHLRMHEVEQAVHDAEAEEAELGRDDSTVPAVIRPGSYGSSSAAGGTPRSAP
ncbi:hypothetical protein COHA_000485 [Chlorella ohadii]|uniref:Fungal lipase-type domain-containing protein n=1 Tax=Chlorella ohadii TaxID=2649997 RepID=A0AAD5E2W3_9CHLO|nr:hypothetical protein COHA_000485 [Chlorella ohadii]